MTTRRTFLSLLASTPLARFVQAQIPPPPVIHPIPPTTDLEFNPLTYCGEVTWKKCPVGHPPDYEKLLKRSTWTPN